MAWIQFGKGDLGPEGPRSPLPNWILAIFLVQFFNQTRVIFSSLVCYLSIAALASPWLLWVKELKESRLKPRSFQLLQAIDCLYLKVSRLPYYNRSYGKSDLKIRQKLAFWGPNNSPDHQKKIFLQKKNLKKNNKKSEKSFQSGPNLKSFAFNRGGRVDLRAPKAIGGPKNWAGAQKKRGGRAQN